MKKQATSWECLVAKYRWRFYAILLLLFVCMLILFVRMVQLSVFDRAFLVRASDARVVRLVDIPAYRGMITDRNGVPLAVSAPMFSVWVNPQKVHFDKGQLSKLCRVLKCASHTILRKIAHNKHKTFLYLARRVSPHDASCIRALHIHNLFLKPIDERFYPLGALVAHVLGFTNVDDRGQEGLELAYDDWLKGTPGKRRVIKDRLGKVVSKLDIVRPAKQGHNLVLSIDSRIQYVAYSALLAAVPKFHAKSGSVIVLDVSTGEILAMVNVPSYNPNLRAKNFSDRRNRAVTDTFEPGSTMKTFSLASALETGKYRVDTRVDTRPGYMFVDGHKIRDDANYGIVNLTQILQRSSNVGAAKIALSLPPEHLSHFLKRMGFGQLTGSGFPGESKGTLRKHRFKSKTGLATAAYGYGISVTAVQLTQAYAILAAGGVRRPISFLKQDSPPKGVRVIKPGLAKTLCQMLGAVAEEGNSTRARIANYLVGGKTGTSYIAKAGGYQKDRYNASFIGIAPLEHPRLVVSVVLHGVHGSVHFGAQVAAPIFATVMQSALTYMHIAPTTLSDLSS